MKTYQWRASVMAVGMATAFPMAANADDDTAVLRQEIEQLRQELSELRALVTTQRQNTAT